MKSLELISEIASQYWTQLDTPVSLSLQIMLRHGDWSGVLNYKLDPKHYEQTTQAQKLAADIAAVSFLKKCPIPPLLTPQQRSRAAKDAFERGESDCYHTNERLSPFVVSPFQEGVQAEFLRLVRRRWLDIVGRCASDTELKNLSAHGPGSVYPGTVANPTAADKYTELISLTRESADFLWLIAGTLWGRRALENVANRGKFYVLTRGNKFASVPKTALTDRPIAIEPSLNIYVQKGVGTTLRNRLKRRRGWDLNHAQDVHREMARKASVDGSFSTLDLSNASDTLCKNLVKFIASGTPWWDLLNSLRSPRTLIDGKWRLLEKFSSMGNGYTFELETTVFCAIIEAALIKQGVEPVLGWNYYVFGDDLIVPTDCVGLVQSGLRFCGFTLNMTKSFTDGVFRESCGGDYFFGHPVRGYYFKAEDIGNDSEEIFTLHNGTKVCLENSGINTPWFLDWLVNHHVHPRLRRGGPRRLGSAVLHGREERFRWRHQIRWLQVVRWSTPEVIPWAHFPDTVILACRITSPDSTGIGIASRTNNRAFRPSLDWVSDS